MPPGNSDDDAEMRTARRRMKKQHSATALPLCASLVLVGAACTQAPKIIFAVVGRMIDNMCYFRSERFPL